MANITMVLIVSCGLIALIIQRISHQHEIKSLKESHQLKLKIASEGHMKDLERMTFEVKKHYEQVVEEYNRNFSVLMSEMRGEQRKTEMLYDYSQKYLEEVIFHLQKAQGGEKTAQPMLEACQQKVGVCESSLATMTVNLELCTTSHDSRNHSSSL
mmetsp:Transcript_9355/g.12320  ORF Transcript_9355/g.12320 Transcript_9355/m.12320 type:complete len:156 (-) Transcript_9355:80-547(-)